MAFIRSFNDRFAKQNYDEEKAHDYTDSVTKGIKSIHMP